MFANALIELLKKENATPVVKEKTRFDYDLFKLVQIACFTGEHGRRVRTLVDLF